MTNRLRTAAALIWSSGIELCAEHRDVWRNARQHRPPDNVRVLIAVNDGDGFSEIGKLERRDQRGGRLAGAPLWNRDWNDWHDRAPPNDYE